MKEKVKSEFSLMGIFSLLSKTKKEGGREEAVSYLNEDYGELRGRLLEMAAPGGGRVEIIERAMKEEL